MNSHPIPRPTGLYARHPDLLVAEELAENHRLVRWLCGYCFKESSGEIASCAASTTSWDDAVRRTAGGDTDVVVEVTFTDGSRRRLLIEDTLGAAARPGQAARYRRRADLTGAGVPTRCVVIGPAADLRASHAELRPFHAMVDIEAIVVELRRQAEEMGGRPARRLTWRADALDVLRRAAMARSSDRRTPDRRLALARALSDGHPSVVPFLRPA